MIAEADNQIVQWTKDVLGEGIAALVPPAKEQKGRGVGIYLLEVMPEPRQHVAVRPRLQASLKYLITCWDDSAVEAHRVLGELLEAAMQHPQYEICAESPAPALWTAFGIAPQPCLTLKTRAWKELETKPVKLVRKVVMETALGRPLYGVVLGPEAVPLCDAQVELPALRLATRTGTHGEFEFANVPVSGGLGNLLVSARGREMTFDMKDLTESPVSINFEMKE